LLTPDISRTTAARILLVPLLALLLVKGIVPALTVVQSDFPNYYTAGLIARTGKGIDRLYDDAWFQQEIERAGISQQGKFSPFPPPTALFFIPLSFLAPLDALRFMTLLNVAMLIASIVLVRRLVFSSFSDAAAFVLLAGLGLSNGVRLGQLYIALSLTLLLGYFLQKEGFNALAGITAGVLMPVKYFSAVLFIDALLKKNRSMSGWAIVTVLFIVTLSVGVLGWDIHRQFIDGVLGRHLAGNLTLQNPYSPLFQSFDSLLRRLFLYDGELNAHPLVTSTAMYQGLKIICLLGVATGTVVAARASYRHSSDVFLGVLCIAVLLVAPATATYHFVLLWLPVGLILRHFDEQKEQGRFSLLLACYAAIGFIPYGAFVQFDGDGLLTFLAYPRLILLLVLFVIAVSAALRLPVAREAGSEATVPEGVPHGS
jgi:Glycosyltransferase family 87